MSNQLYDIARVKFATKQWGWAGPEAFKVVLMNENQAFDATHANMASLDPNNRMGVTGDTQAGGGQQLNDAAVETNGACSNGGVNTTFQTVVAGGHTVKAIVIYQHNGSNDSANYPVAWIDQATGLPLTPNGGDIIITWDTGTNKIFRL